MKPPEIDGDDDDDDDVPAGGDDVVDLQDPTNAALLTDFSGDAMYHSK